MTTEGVPTGSAGTATYNAQLMTTIRVPDVKLCAGSGPPTGVLGGDVRRERDGARPTSLRLHTVVVSHTASASPSASTTADAGAKGRDSYTWCAYLLRQPQAPVEQGEPFTRNAQPYSTAQPATHSLRRSDISDVAFMGDS